jgi:hypothetical protein
MTEPAPTPVEPAPKLPIQASRVLATWDDWLLDKAARELEWERARARRAKELEQRRAGGEPTEPTRKPRPATVVAGWTVRGRAGRVSLYRDGDGDGDLTLAAAETLAGALLRAAAEARRPRPIMDPEQPREMTTIATSNQPNGSPGVRLLPARVSAWPSSWVSTAAPSPRSAPGSGSPIAWRAGSSTGR